MAHHGLNKGLGDYALKDVEFPRRWDPRKDAVLRHHELSTYETPA